MNRCAPWDRIKKNEIVYFKDSGSPVTIKAGVLKVKQFSDLTPTTVKKIINQYGGTDGIDIKDKNKFYQLFKNKKYCILIFIKDIKPIKPFNINKSGFGMMSAWLALRSVDEIKLNDNSRTHKTIKKN